MKFQEKSKSVFLWKNPIGGGIKFCAIFALLPKINFQNFYEIGSKSDRKYKKNQI